MAPTSRCLQYRAHPRGQRSTVIITSLTERDPRLVESRYYGDRRDSWGSLTYGRIVKASGVDVELTRIEEDTLAHLVNQGLESHGWYDVAYDMRTMGGSGGGMLV